MDSMRDHRLPQDLADGHRSGEEPHRTIEILRREPAQSIDGLPMDALVSRRQAFDGSRPLGVRRLDAERELATGDAITDERVKLGEVPRQLTERSTAGVGSEIVLCCWQ